MKLFYVTKYKNIDNLGIRLESLQFEYVSDFDMPFEPSPQDVVHFHLPLDYRRTLCWILCLQLRNREKRMAV